MRISSLKYQTLTYDFDIQIINLRSTTYKTVLTATMYPKTNKTVGTFFIKHKKIPKQCLGIFSLERFNSISVILSAYGLDLQIQS